MYSTDMPYVLALSALFLTVFSVIEFGKRRFGLSPEYTRRVAHVVAGLLVLLNHAVLSPWAFVLMVVGGGLAIILTSVLKIGTAVHNVERRTYGEFVLSLGYLGAYAVSSINPAVFVPAILVITFADPLAGITGRLLTSTRKTFAGSLVFFAVSSVAIVVSFPAVSIAAAFGVAAVVTVIERVSFRGFDNLTVPIATAALLLVF